MLSMSISELTHKRHRRDRNFAMQQLIVPLQRYSSALL